MFDSTSFSSDSFGVSWSGLEEIIKKTRSKRKESISISGDLNLPLLMNQKVYKEVLTSNQAKLIQEDEEIVLLVQALFLEGVF
jgi:hypothetical protein